MITRTHFSYQPGEHENERASNSYLMSVVALIAGMPLPVINLLATLGFFLGNRRSTYFVRWHCTQALLSQISVFLVNSVAVSWTVLIIWGSEPFSNQYIAYVITAVGLNIVEFAATVYTAIQTRKGIHVQWWFYSDLTHLICKP